ncbi:WD40 repeat-like protein [Trichodelitschia bisporula]|uniref:WD40 repeat-like protein n=1 Tax=Trichodelitschia bisporula TaxID=703511 RepID=A0A6G1HJY8_9PEZI|nr:WD40 repeat-like protein [Trichodelitschia bisporula]
MEVSKVHKCLQPPLPSPCGTYLALLTPTHLELRSTLTTALLRRIPAPPKPHSLSWSPKGLHILIASATEAHTYSLPDPSFTSTISNGTGSMGPLVHAHFGPDPSSLLLYSDFSSRVVAWSLPSGRSVEIRDPKFASSRGSGFAPDGTFALLGRHGATDVLSLHTPASYALLRAVPLQSVDAQGLTWSRDGRWLAVWEAPGVGFRVYVYTAGGELYRIFSGETGEEWVGLGVRSVEWAPGGAYFAVGGWDGRVTLLNTRTFSPTIVLAHTPQIHLPTVPVHSEIATAASRSYAPAPQPVTPPAPPAPKSGISILAFAPRGTYLATRSDAAPTVVWIWDLGRLAPAAVLLQHSPVRALAWHAARDVLLVTCAQDEPVVYTWMPGDGPGVLPVPLGRRQVDAKWVLGTGDGKLAIVVGDGVGGCVVWPEGREVVVDFPPVEGEEGESSDDSLYEILTGRQSPRRRAAGDGDDGRTEALLLEVEDDTGVVEDTFVGKAR